MTYRRITEGEFSGWQCWEADPFETNTVGPFYTKRRDGEVVCAFRIEERHTRQGQIAHGGSLMTFADSALFATAIGELGADFRGVTATFECNFLAPVKLGSIVEARGEVVRAGKSLVFVRGVARADGEPVLGYSGTLLRTGSWKVSDRN